MTDLPPAFASTPGGQQSGFPGLNIPGYGVGVYIPTSAQVPGPGLISGQVRNNINELEVVKPSTALRALIILEATLEAGKNEGLGVTVNGKVIAFLEQTSSTTSAVETLTFLVPVGGEWSWEKLTVKPKVVAATTILF